MPTLSPPWLTVREASERLAISIQRVHQLVRNKHLRVRILQGRTHVNAQDVQKRKANPPPPHRRALP